MAQRHPAFDEFAADMRQLRSRLELVTKSADAIERAAVACPDCGDRLRKEWAKPARCQHDGPHCDHSHRSPSEWPCRGSNTCGCDQGGARDEWVCRNRECGRIVEEAEYWLAVRQHLEQPEAS